MALVHVDKEVVLFLVSSHVDETDPANVTPIGIFSQLARPLIAMSLKLLLVYSHYLCFSPFFALGHIVRLSHMKVTHLFS